MSLEDMTSAEEMHASVEHLLVFRWIGTLRYVALGAFLALAAWLLTRQTKLLSAILAVAFGAGFVSAIVSGLGALGS